MAFGLVFDLRTSPDRPSPREMLVKLPMWLSTLPNCSGFSHATVKAQMPLDEIPHSALRRIAGDIQSLQSDGQKFIDQKVRVAVARRVVLERPIAAVLRSLGRRRDRARIDEHRDRDRHRLLMDEIVEHHGDSKSPRIRVASAIHEHHERGRLVPLVLSRHVDAVVTLRSRKDLAVVNCPDVSFPCGTPSRTTRSGCSCASARTARDVTTKHRQITLWMSCFITGFRFVDWVLLSVVPMDFSKVPLKVSRQTRRDSDDRLKPFHAVWMPTAGLNWAEGPREAPGVICRDGRVVQVAAWGRGEWPRKRLIRRRTLQEPSEISVEVNSTMPIVRRSTQRARRDVVLVAGELRWGATSIPVLLPRS